LFAKKLEKLDKWAESSGPFFLLDRFCAGPTSERLDRRDMTWQGRRHWQQSVETALAGLGYELVDAERSAGGLLRVTIDHRHTEGAEERAITVDDCERATRQLQHVLEVEGVEYQRLEVSSPGLDRPLRGVADYARFAGQPVQLTLKAPFSGRKHWRGRLEPDGDGWSLVLPAEGGGAPQALRFGVDEVREARLVPVIDFKGRGRTPGADAESPQTAARGGRKQRPARAEGAGAPVRPEPAADAGMDGGRIR
jgi:ribosome maturation factor RimP